MKRIRLYFGIIVSAFIIIATLISCGTSLVAKIGMEKEKALALFNEAPAYNVDEKTYYWFDDDFYNLFSKYNINLKESDNQLTLITESLNNNDLKNELNQLHFKFRMIKFDEDDKLSEFYYDLNHKFDLSNDYSCFGLKNINNFDLSKARLEYFIEEKGQFKNNKNKICFKINLVDYDNISYSIEFDDGSLFKGKLSDAIDLDMEYTVNIKSNKGKMQTYLELCDFIDDFKFNPKDYKDNGLLEKINLTYFANYFNDFIYLIDTAKYVGYIDKNNNVVEWNTKLEYLPSYVDINNYVGEMTETTYGGVIYNGHKLNPYYEVVGIKNKNDSSIKFKDNVQIIKSGAITDMKYLYTLQIPNTVKTIEEGAIKNCKNLLSVAIPASVETIGNGNFDNCPKLVEIFNSSKVYTEEMAMRYLLGPVRYYTSYEEYVATNNLYYFGGRDSNFIMAYFEDNGENHYSKYPAGWYLLGATKTTGKLSLPSTFKVGTKTISEYSIFDTAFQGDDVITEVTIPNNVKLIGRSAFSDCTNLTKVVANGVTTIDSSAFKNCTSLETVELPEATKVKYETFKNCTSLETIELPKVDINYFDDYSIFEGCEKLANVSLDVSWCISNTMFKDCTSLTTLNAPNAYYIYNEAFKNCTSLVTFNSSDIQTIHYDAFKNCSSLTTIVLSDYIDYIADGSFEGCTSLEYYTEGNCKYLTSKTNNYIYLQDIIDKSNDTFEFNINVKKLNNNIFNNYPNLKHLILPDNINYDDINNILMRCNNLEFTLEDECYYIGSTANPYMLLIKSNLNVDSLNIQDTTKYIYDNAFKDSNISIIEIPESIEVIGNYAFSNTKITELNISPNTNCDFRYGVFSNNLDLTSVEFDSLNGYGGLFMGCTKLEEVTCNTSFIPYETFRNCTSLNMITNANTYGFSNVSANAFENCTSLTEIKLANGCYIEYNAFRNCKVLETIGLNKIDYVGDNAFEGCISFTNIDLSNASRIGYGAFRNCKNATSLILGTNLRYIGSYAFEGCEKLTAIDIPNTVETLGGSLFNKCSLLASVMIPISVVNLEMNMFTDCPQITKFYYEGSLDELTRLGFKMYMLELNQNIYFYSSTQPTDTRARYWHYDSDNNKVLW